jgi:hypothetical protein
MSSHYTIRFSDMVGDVVNFAGSVFKKTADFIRKRILEGLELHKQFNQYQGKQVTSLFDRNFTPSSPVLAEVLQTAPFAQTTRNEDQSIVEQFLEKLSPEQLLVLERIQNIARKQGYDVQALPSPSDDLILDIYFTKDKEKLAVKRRNYETPETLCQ